MKSIEALDPKPGEVRIKVAYCGICGTDMHIFRGEMDNRVHIPQPIGHEMSGIIDAVGDGSDWTIGKKVTVRPLAPCKKCAVCRDGLSHICSNLKFLGIDTPGAMSNYWYVPAYTVHQIPEKLDLKTAALIEPLAVACHDVRLSGLESGKQAVIIGGGPIGLLIGFVAENTGASVMILEINEKRVSIAKSMGLKAFNPHKMDVRSFLKKRGDAIGADVVFEVSASQSGIDMATDLLRPRGSLMAVGIFSKPPFLDLQQFFKRELRLFGLRVYEPEDFNQAIKLAAEGGFPLSKLISNCIPLSRTEEAFAIIENESNVMKVLIDCIQGEENAG